MRRNLLFQPLPLTGAMVLLDLQAKADGAGDMMIGFSGSTATNYISAFYTWRLAGGATLAVPQIFRDGSTNFTDARWGDYSATTLDPSDDCTWTVQEFAEYAGHGVFPWKTAIAETRAGE